MKRTSSNNQIILFTVAVATVLIAILLAARLDSSRQPSNTLSPQTLASQSITMENDHGELQATSTSAVFHEPAFNKEERINKKNSQTAKLSKNDTLSNTEQDEIFKMSRDEATTAVQEVETIVFERANGYFNKESIDKGWAPQRTRELNQAFTQHPALSKVSVKSIECRNTQCQIIAYTPQSKDADFFSAALYSALEENEDKEIPTIAAIARQMESGLTSAYVARKGYALDFFREDHL